MKDSGYSLKRFLDFTLAVTGMFFSLPLWAIFSYAIWLEDGLPVFYSQERVGRYGRIFKSLKFRSMIKDAEKDTGPVQAREDDPRVTLVGRWLRRTAMDELPQLLNIASGQMSFVGPRPLRLREIQQDVNSPQGPCSESCHKRLLVRPGLTGVAQVFAPRDISISKKTEYDIWYIENQCLWLDIRLILTSCWISINRRWDTAKKAGFRLQGV